MTRKKFRLKKEPVKPLLKDFHGQSHSDEAASIYEHIDPSKLVTLLEEAREKDPKAYLELELDETCCFYESDIPSAKLVLKWTSKPEVEHDKAMVRYKADLKKYNNWYFTNKANVKAELKIRETEAREAALRKADRLDRKARAFRKKIKN